MGAVFWGNMRGVVGGSGAAGAGCCRGGAGTRVGLSKACANTFRVVDGLWSRAASMRLRSWLVCGWVRDLRSCCGTAASMRLDPRRSDVAQSRPLRAGSPVAIPAVAVSIHVRPIRAAEGCALPAASMPPRFSLRTPHGRRHPCRRPSVPDGNGLRCKRRRWRSIARATPPLAPAAQSSARQAPAAGRRGSVGVCA